MSARTIACTCDSRGSSSAEGTQRVDATVHRVRVLSRTNYGAAFRTGTPVRRPCDRPLLGRVQSNELSRLSTHSGPTRCANRRPKPALQRREQRCTARSCSSAPSGFQRQRTHRFFVERLAPGKQTVERLRIENGFEFSEELCASAPLVCAPPRCARVTEQGRC